MTKPRISYQDFQAQRDEWLAAYHRMRSVPVGTKLYDADGFEVELDWVSEDPHPPSVWVKYRHEGKTRTAVIRKGNPVLLELHRNAKGA